ncbi:MAG: FHA domain-containing protein, partial [Anaerolineae bacterium]
MNDRSHGADTIAGPSLAPRLEVTRGEQQGESFKLKLKTRLGRERDNEIVLVDPKVSRYHAQISLERSRWVISDLGSANGTYLNGQVILTSLALEPGDTIALGDTSLVFRLPEAAEEAQAITRPATVQAPLAAAPARPAESRVDTRRLIWIAGGLILVLLLAVAGILTLLRQDDRAAGETAAPLSTSVSRAVNANWELVYEDDFSDSDSGWDDSFDKFTTKQYGNLKYHIEVNDSNLWARGLANRNVGDFELEVEATQEAGPTNNGYGLLFRFQDRNNFYRFDVSGDGFFLLSKFQDGEWITLQDWTAHPAIKQGMTTNLLKVLAVGPDISVFANGQELTRVRDDAFANGNFGFFASTFSEPKLWVSFDNLKLWAPSGTEIAILPTATPTRLAPEATATPTTPA